jgi:hypothetical protein
MTTNMDSRIAGSMKDNMNMDSRIAGSMNDNMDSRIAGSMNDSINMDSRILFMFMLSFIDPAILLSMFVVIH